MAKSTSIIIPAFNEKFLMAKFIKNLDNYLKHKLSNYEIDIIENGSNDGTVELIDEIAKDNHRVNVFHLKTASYGKALFFGLSKAKGDYFIIFNVDFWDKRLIDLINVDLLGYDMVSCSKNLPGSVDERPFPRRLVTKLFNMLLVIFFSYKGTDTHGIKVLRRSKFGKIIKQCKVKTGIFDSELVIRAERNGLKILELPAQLKELRPNRFGWKRVLHTPNDIIDLFTKLHGNKN